MVEIPKGYEIVQELTSFRDVASVFKDNPDLWLFCGTEGWHGTKMTLDECEEIIKGKNEKWLPNGAYITIFIVDPKHVSLKWGEVHLKSTNEVDWLRKRVENTILNIVGLQKHNVSANLFE